MSASQRLGPYELQQRIKRESQEEAWRALDVHNHRTVALYISRADARVSANAISQFHQKIESLAFLHHPNIAQVLDVRSIQSNDTSEQGILVVTEYIEGSSLATFIRETSHEGKIPTLNELVALLAPIGEAIDYAHRQGIIHGALRPENILLEKQADQVDSVGKPRLIGFCTPYLQPPLTLPLASTFYIAPEQAQGYLENTRSDIYALGVILYEMCTGTLPFQGTTPADIMMQHIHSTPPSPVQANSNLPAAFTAVLLRSLAKDPNARFATATEMVIALGRSLNITPQQVGLQAASWSGIPGADNPASTPARSNPGLPPAVSVLTPAATPVVQPPAPTYSRDSQPGLAAQQASQPMPAIAQPSRPMPVAARPATAPQPVLPPPVPRRKKRGGLYILLAALLLLVLLASSTGYYLYTHHPVSAGSQVLGHAFFTNSGQYALNSNQGVADTLQIHVENFGQPAAGKAYYFWLLADNDNQDHLPVAVGSSPGGGKIDLHFTDHNNRDLLADYSQFLVTEEDAGAPPNAPSFDKTTWRYYASFSQALEPSTHLSLLDHLRHLLAQDPKLGKVGLSGGLDVWLYRDALNVMVLSSSLRDSQAGGDPNFLRRQLVRVLDYLDGSQYIQQVENLPAGVSPVQIDPTVAKVALLEFDATNQQPPGYLTHISSHLASVSQAPGVTQGQRALAIHINQELNNVHFWLDQVHKDAQQLIQMSDAQLLQPSSRPLFNDLYIQANRAFTGEFDPNTNQVKEGVTQIHADILRLATFDIQSYQAA